LDLTTRTAADVADSNEIEQQKRASTDATAEQIATHPVQAGTRIADERDGKEKRACEEQPEGTEFQGRRPGDSAENSKRRGGREVHACSMVEGRMTEPIASRPHMPGYGILESGEGTGLLPWSWATERLERSHDYWVATSDAGGRPHVMPVWGVWLDEALWFSSSRASRKARNLASRPHCAITTDNAFEPVVIEGEAELIDDLSAIRAFTERSNQKYGTDYPLEFFTQPSNACFRVRPVWAFGLTESDFTGSPTRWTFPR
jgi:pyridoxamine 5'-phosphate oxidase-like protein